MWQQDNPLHDLFGVDGFGISRSDLLGLVGDDSLAWHLHVTDLLFLHGHFSEDSLLDLLVQVFDDLFGHLHRLLLD